MQQHQRIIIPLSFSKDDEGGRLSLGPGKGWFKERRRRKQEQNKEAEKKGDRKEESSNSG